MPKINRFFPAFFQIREITDETRHRHAYWDPLRLGTVRRAGTQEVAVRCLVLGCGHRQQAGVWRHPRVRKRKEFSVAVFISSWIIGSGQTEIHSHKTWLQRKQTDVW